jgi:hypothetical protein
VAIKEDCRVLELQETEADADGRTGCIVIFERKHEGRLQFFKLRQNEGKISFEAIREPQAIETEQQGPGILDYKVRRSLVKHANQYKHFGIVLHKDLRLDFYFDF